MSTQPSSLSDSLLLTVEPYTARISSLNDVCDLGVPDLHGNSAQSRADVGRPLMPALVGEGMCDGLRIASPPSRPANARCRSNRGRRPGRLSGTRWQFIIFAICSPYLVYGLCEP